MALIHSSNHFLGIRKWMVVSQQVLEPFTLLELIVVQSILLRACDCQTQTLSNREEARNLQSRDGIHDHDSLIPNWFRHGQTAFDNPT